jgi:hypothetical protein
LQRNYIIVCFQVAELQEKISKAVEENQKLQGKLLLLSREKQAADKKVIHSISYTFNSRIIMLTFKVHSVVQFISY